MVKIRARVGRRVGLGQESKGERKQKMRSRAGHVQVGGFHVDPVIALYLSSVSRRSRTWRKNDIGECPIFISQSLIYVFFSAD